MTRRASTARCCSIANIRRGCSPARLTAFSRFEWRLEGISSQGAVTAWQPLFDLRDREGALFISLHRFSTLDGMLKALKTQLFQMIARPEAGRFLADRQRGRGVIFMLHRFACAENNWQGYDVPTLRRFLAYLRASRAQLVTVDQLLAAFEAGIDPTAAPMISFTIDDGFADFGNHGVPAFAEYDCPTTVFVVPNVIAGKTWFWWN